MKEIADIFGELCMDQDYIRYAEAKIAVKRGHSFVLPESFFFLTSAFI